MSSLPPPPHTPLLPTVYLCAIIRNEATNCAGGIPSYLQHIVPYVGMTLILDTGSTDDTVSLVHTYQQQYPYQHLHLVEAGVFHGFAQARNQALEELWKVINNNHNNNNNNRDTNNNINNSNTNITSNKHNSCTCCCCTRRYILILDADEVLTYDMLMEIRTTLQNTCRYETEKMKHSDKSISNIINDNNSDTDNNNDNDNDNDNDSDSDNTESDDNHIKQSSSDIKQMDINPSCICFRCIKFGIQNMDRDGKPVHRSNSGLLNPRIFPCHPSFSFVNMVANRFERVMFDSAPIPSHLMSHDTSIIMHHYIPSVRERNRKNQRYRAGMENEHRLPSSSPSSSHTPLRTLSPHTEFKENDITANQDDDDGAAT